MTERPDEEPGSTDPDRTVARSSEGSGTETIGPYRLLERLGEGGMGEVWLAEQTRPVRRQVALKVIKAGMDTAQVVNAQRSKQIAEQLAALYSAWGMPAKTAVSRDSPGGP